MQSTISIFQIYLRHLPKIMPGDISIQADRIMSEIENDKQMDLKQLEEKIISFGYRSWPWHKAYREYLSRAIEQMFDHLVAPKLNIPLSKKFKKYRQHGLPTEILLSGSGLHHYFDAEEMRELSSAVVEAKRYGAELAGREIQGQHKEKFLRRVSALDDILKEIKIDLEIMKKMAAAEDEHLELADEIRAKIKKFEQGLVLLAPEPDREEVRQAMDFFTGRRRDLNRSKGIHRPLNIDFYGSPIDPWIC